VNGALADPRADTLCPPSARALIMQAEAAGWTFMLTRPRTVRGEVLSGDGYEPRPMVMIRLSVSRPARNGLPYREYHVVWCAEIGKILKRGPMHGRVGNGSWFQVATVGEIKDVMSREPVPGQSPGPS
jgi:hypothetical protein